MNIHQSRDDKVVLAVYNFVVFGYGVAGFSELLNFASLDKDDRTRLNPVIHSVEYLDVDECVVLLHELSMDRQYVQEDNQDERKNFHRLQIKVRLILSNLFVSSSLNGVSADSLVNPVIVFCCACMPNAKTHRLANRKCFMMDG